MITLTGIGVVQMRNPDLASKYTIDKGTLVRYNRGQEVITYKDTKWKSIETEILAFSHMRSTKLVELQDFIDLNIGREITISLPRVADCGYAPHIYTGYIHSDVIDYKTTGKNGCSYVYEFGFVLLYKILRSDIQFLIAENHDYLITQRGDNIRTEA
jgi:hypothetical protein